MEFKIINFEEYVKYSKNFSFNVGESYFNNLGKYVVNSISNEYINVLFEDGTKKDINKKIATRQYLDIYLDMLKPYIALKNNNKYIAEDKPFKDDFNEEDFSWTLGAFSRYINLKAEVGGKDHVKKFIERYSKSVYDANEENIRLNNNILFVNDNKNGQELRISIPSYIVKNKRFCLPGVGHIEESTKNKPVVKINNTRIAWMLIEKYGFIFGKTQNYRKILSTINPNHKTAFLEGYSFVYYGQNKEN
ncbi:MAG: hypothetical protein M0Q13_14145 [Methanothrix sp.]|jgi:hypothetical protein|nr:hypothetical protein [Methanothrix sp.]